jgi:hypothetical protein
MPRRRTTKPAAEPAIIARRWFAEIEVGFDLEFCWEFELEEGCGWLVEGMVGFWFEE